MFNQASSFISSNKPTSLKERMAAFDELPVEIRHAINFCSVPICAVKIEELLKIERFFKKEDQAIQTLIKLINDVAPTGGIQGENIPIR